LETLTQAGDSRDSSALGLRAWTTIRQTDGLGHTTELNTGTEEAACKGHASGPWLWQWIVELTALHKADRATWSIAGPTPCWLSRSDGIEDSGPKFNLARRAAVPALRAFIPIVALGDAASPCFGTLRNAHGMSVFISLVLLLRSPAWRSRSTSCRHFSPRRGSHPAGLRPRPSQAALRTREQIHSRPSRSVRPVGTQR
jgi:hypothetical protein